MLDFSEACRLHVNLFIVETVFGSEIKKFNELSKNYFDFTTFPLGEKEHYETEFSSSSDSSDRLLILC